MLAYPFPFSPPIFVPSAELLVRCNLFLACWLLHRNQPQIVQILHVPGTLTFNRGRPFLTGQHVLCPSNTGLIPLKTFVTPCPNAFTTLSISYWTSGFYTIPFLGLGQAIRNLLPLARQSQHKYLRNKNP